MFDPKKYGMTLYTPRKCKLSEVLNFTVDDLRCHKRPQLSGFRFVPRGDSVAYLKVPGEPKGAVCVSLEEGDYLAVIAFHPSRTGKEAWEMAATEKGCRELAGDKDMEEDKEWAIPSHGPYVPPDVGAPFGLYEIVIRCLKRFVDTAEDMTPLPDECYF